jgi:hypothetical protein
MSVVRDLFSFSVWESNDFVSYVKDIGPGYAIVSYVKDIGPGYAMAPRIVNLQQFSTEIRIKGNEYDQIRPKRHRNALKKYIHISSLLSVQRKHLAYFDIRILGHILDVVVMRSSATGNK